MQKSGIRTFYTILITQVLSMIGSRMTSFALGIWVFLETGDVTPLGLVAFFQVMGAFLAMGVGGILSDRYDRRIIMAVTDFGQALGTFALMLLFFTDSLAIWHIYVVAIFTAMLGGLQGPAFDAAVTQLVPDEHRARANSFRQMAGPAANIIAPAAAGGLYALLDVGGIMVLDLLTFGVAVLTLYFAHIPRPEVTDEGAQSHDASFWQQLTFGWRWMYRKRPLFLTALMATLANFFLMVHVVLFTPYILVHTDNNKAILGSVESLFGVGGVIGALLIGAWGGTKKRMNTILPIIIAQGLLLVAFGMARTPAGWFVISFSMALGFPIINTLFLTIMQQKVPPDIQGRVFATLGQISMMIQPIGVLMVGPLADHVFEPAVGTRDWDIVAPLVGDVAGSGMGLLYVVAGVMLTAVMVGAALTPMVRNMEALLPDYQSSADMATAAEPDAARDPLPTPPLSGQDVPAQA